TWKIDHSVMDARIPIMIRLSDHPAIDSKTSVGEESNEWQSGMSADEAADVETIEPSRKPQVIQLHFVEKFARVSRTSVTKENAPSFHLDDLLVRPSPEPLAGCFAESHGG